MFEYLYTGVDKLYFLLYPVALPLSLPWHCVSWPCHVVLSRHPPSCNSFSFSQRVSSFSSFPPSKRVAKKKKKIENKRKVEKRNQSRASHVILVFGVRMWFFSLFFPKENYNRTFCRKCSPRTSREQEKK